MTTREIILKLNLHQMWRTGEIEDMPFQPHELTEIIYEAIRKLKELDEKEWNHD